MLIAAHDPSSPSHSATAAAGESSEVESPLGPSSWLGALHLGFTLALSGLGLAAASGAGWLWVLGQALLALAGLRWFLLLHEAGHRTLFPSRLANRLTGIVAGVWSGIPSIAWRRVHAGHHRWTGWQDRNPTTAALAQALPRGPLRWLLEAAWWLRLPLIAILYRRPFWGLGVAPTRAEGSRRPPTSAVTPRLLLEATLVLGVPLLGIVWLGPEWVALHLLPGLLGGLALQERLILSQHTHLPQERAGERAVRPFSARAQDRFTRSLTVPAWISWLLLGAEAHSLHHRLPQVPGYRLARGSAQARHAVDWLKWLRTSRAHSAEDYLFCSSETCTRCAGVPRDLTPEQLNPSPAPLPPTSARTS